jgi:hypothetical protein
VEMAISSERVPIYPNPAPCPTWFSQFWIYSNIFDFVTVRLPYFDWLNDLKITNEYIDNFEWTNYYYKVFNVNWVKNWAIKYRTDAPDIDYYWSFTICVED